jgi:hypothetical protein
VKLYILHTVRRQSDRFLHPHPPSKARYLRRVQPCSGGSNSCRAIFWCLRRRRWSLSLYTDTHTAVSEARSLVQRIEYRFDKRLGLCGVELGTLYQKIPSGYLAVNIRRQGRTRDMQHWLSSFAMATLVDLAIFLEGRDRGEGYSQASPLPADKTCTEQTDPRPS